MYIFTSTTYIYAPDFQHSTFPRIWFDRVVEEAAHCPDPRLAESSESYRYWIAALVPGVVWYTRYRNASGYCLPRHRTTHTSISVLQALPACLSLYASSSGNADLTHYGLSDDSKTAAVIPQCEIVVPFSSLVHCLNDLLAFTKTVSQQGQAVL